ncbi:endonuclease/exonuclease/phosphatase family metal-dependent hydrolase [Rhizobium sp. BK077]|uniref:endonuclease/exonuclease/phosphatase family protein n=1 Tax=unclassified Rhizobium TaxID=2613769 RepID=UPI0016217953|nr:MULTISPECIES: endonuclease/exonuclease/phosphatase family protein [unclassified Rhizobium]MBB3303301.1 endonuclease/exonuclease/phosphatase family metal-dependent hydrolase [Rhizobium sp. BK112]MBB3372436.1 endonuclease/exonuclease/phosphatase family metal-dependent hydrolase [Rhizobium sp. BK077]MBB4183159.1 endonuclease/exonuclease/phosphatase family metal-dependent hydrolase [Rhizobium sp. BK109]
MNFLACLAMCCVLAGSAIAADLRIATFNTESDDDTQPAKVAETIAAMGSFDLLAVQEVESADTLKAYTEAAAKQGGRWRFVISESGVNVDREADLLGIIYRTDRLRQLETNELHLIRSKPDGTKYGRTDWSLRGALSLRLLDLQTGDEFRVTTVHLKCCNEPGTRTHQAALLAEELAKSTVPNIVLGDTNIPIEPGDDHPDSANFPAFTSLGPGSGRIWLRPVTAIKTQCSPDFNSMLDQIYVPTGTVGAAEILFPEASYCSKDAEGYSDHRPVVAQVKSLAGPERQLMGASLSTAVKLTNAELENREAELQGVQRVGDIVSNGGQ